MMKNICLTLLITVAIPSASQTLELYPTNAQQITEMQKIFSCATDYRTAYRTADYIYDPNYRTLRDKINKQFPFEIDIQGVLPSEIDLNNIDERRLKFEFEEERNRTRTRFLLKKLKIVKSNDFSDINPYNKIEYYKESIIEYYPEYPTAYQNARTIYKEKKKNHRERCVARYPDINVETTPTTYAMEYFLVDRWLKEKYNPTPYDQCIRREIPTPEQKAEWKQLKRKNREEDERHVKAINTGFEEAARNLKARLNNRSYLQKLYDSAFMFFERYASDPFQFRLEHGYYPTLLDQGYLAYIREKFAVELAYAYTPLDVKIVKSVLSPIKLLK
jgi:6-pyruvoyl-tetrahydropterin synthase